jgi:hypothetical protein
MDAAAWDGATNNAPSTAAVLITVTRRVRPEKTLIPPEPGGAERSRVLVGELDSFIRRPPR